MPATNGHGSAAKPHSGERFLVVTRAGRNSLHAAWSAPDPQRTYDTFISAYDPAVPPITGDGNFHEYRAGAKVAGYAGFLREQRDLWSSYDYICLIDDDIETTPEALNRMFALCSEHRLKIAQPALTHDSYFTYGALLQQPEWQLRWVNFIEMMCPVFHRDALQQIAPLFEDGMESGIDLIWCNILAESEKDFAVLDAVAIKHTQPLGRNKAANGFVDGRRYEDDITVLLDHYGIPWFGCVPYSALSRSGHETRSRVRLFLSALKLFPAAFRKAPLKRRLISIITHYSHLVLRQPRNVRLSLQPLDEAKR